MRPVAAFLLLALNVFGGSAAFAVDTPQIGSTVAVVNRVMAHYERDQRDLRTGDRVHQDETIEVGVASIGEIELDDKTKLALGPGSRLLLDRFVYDGQRSRGDIVFNLVTGTFRFITGVASKTSYRIRTPAASITVRGTIFDVFISEDRTIWLLLIEGGIRACNDQGDCRNLDRPGQILRITARGEVSRPVNWANLPGRQAVPFETAFPFVVTAPAVDPNPILTRQQIETAAPILPRTPPAPPRVTPPKPKPTPKPQGKPGRTKHAGTERAYDSSPQGPGIGLGIGIGIGIGKMIGKGGGGGYPKGDMGSPGGMPKRGGLR